MLHLFPVCAVIEIKKAITNDALVIAMTRQLVWHETYRGIYPDEKLDNYDLVFYEARDQAYISNPEHYYYLFLDNGKCIGYFSFGPYQYGTYRDFALCLNNLYILKSHQGRGLGKTAFSFVQGFCEENHIPKFFCGCNANNLPALGFYRHMGGTQGDVPNLTLPKEDQIIHFEFYLGE